LSPAEIKSVRSESKSIRKPFLGQTLLEIELK
jgi:hypothetical protein